MKKVLFFTTTYYPNPGAIGINVNRIIEELKDRNFEVHLVCYRRSEESSTSIINDVHVYRVRMPFYYNLKEFSDKVNKVQLSKILKKTSQIVRRLKVMLYLPFFPVKSLLTIYRYYSIASALYSEHDFKIVISSYNPIEGLIASNMLKKKYKDFKLVMYVLDSLSNSGGGKFYSANFTDKMGWKWEKRLYENADLILNMRSHENHHKQDRYNPYRQKIEFVDIPLLIKPDVLAIKSIDKNYNINIIYAGSLNFFYRNPKYACEVFERIDYKNLQVDFYSQGDCEQTLMDYQEKTDGKINRNGYIQHEKLLNKINAASFLLSIGNLNSDMIPSKIFEYISTGKPIIHFYDNENDSALPYLRKYPLALLIKQDYEYINSNIIKVEKFINENKGKSIPFKDIEESFRENKPEFTVDKIVDLIEKGEN